MTEGPLDVALLVPAWSKVQDWKDLGHLYIHQRPLATGPGARVWLCKDRRLVYSYRIDGFLALEDALPGEHDREEESGWALVVSDGRRANRAVDDIPDPHGVVKRWMQGVRYMTPDAKEFGKAPRRPRRPKAAAFTGLPPSTTSPRSLTRMRSETRIWLKCIPKGLTQK